MNISYSILRAVERVRVAKCGMERQKHCPSQAVARGGRRQQTRGDSAAGAVTLRSKSVSIIMSGV